MNYKFLFLFLVIFYGCSPRVNSVIRNSAASPLDIDDDVFGLDENITIHNLCSNSRISTFGVQHELKT